MSFSKNTLNAGMAGVKRERQTKIHVGNTGHQNGYRSGVTYLAINAMLSLPILG